MMPLHLASVQATGKLAEDIDSVKEVWERLRKTYDKADFGCFAQAFQELIASAADERGDVVYGDTLGASYMEFAANKDAGQFFTPWDIAKVSAELISDHGALVRQRLDSDEPFEPVTVMDPACGSGIMLLAFASTYPRWMITRGYVQFYGQDIDETCVRMARINCKLYGLNYSTPPKHPTRRPVVVTQTSGRQPVPR